MYEISLKENEINFKELEKKIFELVCRQACEMIKDILEIIDRKLLEERDKQKYRCKGFKKTVIKTVMGEIEYKRRIYEYITEEGKKAYKYLLDEYLKMVGNKEVKVLFEEMDGIWLNMQGKDRKSKKKKKKELKLGVFYEGWKKINEKKIRYETVNKKAYASFGSSKDFKKLRESKIGQIYNEDVIKARIINGDGAKWIKECIEESRVHFQLDPFHKSKAIIKNIKDKDKAKKLIKKINEGKIEEGLEYLTKLMIENNKDEKISKRLEKLYNYLVNNREGLVPYQMREELKLPEAPEGIEYRNLGTMEHNICDILAMRMKNRKASWSKKGAENLAKILAKAASKKLNDIIKELLSTEVKKEKLEEIVEQIPLSASEFLRKSKKNKIHKIRKGSIPFKNVSTTNGRKAIKNIFKDRCASALKLSFKKRKKFLGKLCPGGLSKGKNF